MPQSLENILHGAEPQATENRKQSWFVQQGGGGGEDGGGGGGGLWGATNLNGKMGQGGGMEKN